MWEKPRGGKKAPGKSVPNGPAVKEGGAQLRGSPTGRVRRTREEGGRYNRGQG